MAQGLVAYAEEDPTRILVEDANRAFNRAEFNERVNRFIHLLQATGIKEGDRIGIHAGNSADFVTTVIAASLAGVALVPVSGQLSAGEAAYIARSANVSALVTDTVHEATSRAAADEAAVGTVFVLGPDLDSRLAEATILEPRPTGFGMPIYYTSGTTGRPKGTRMAELQPVGVDAQIAKFRNAGFNADQRHLVVSPLYHGASILHVLTAVLTGAYLHIMEGFDAEEFLRRVEQHRISMTVLVPTHCVRLLRLPATVRARYDLSSLREVVHVGAIMPRHVKEQMIAWWGPILTDVYGSSELGTISRISASEWLERPGSVGRPVPWFSVQIIGEDGEELPPGGVGTIYLSALNDADLVYLDDPVKTAEAHRAPKQFTLNDLGWVDQDGYLYLADRRDDLIISGGVNIYPAEVEEVLIEHPAVDDVAVFAVPDPEWGHAVKAAVSLRSGWEATRATEAAIKEWARTRMTHLKVPRSIDFHHELPRFANGKLRRRALRDAYWTSSDQAIPSHDSAR